MPGALPRPASSCGLDEFDQVALGSLTQTNRAPGRTALAGGQIASARDDDAMTEPATPYHHGNLRAELLSSAERTLGQTGVAGLSLRALARDIGVSHGARPASSSVPRRSRPWMASASSTQVAGTFDERLLAFARG